MFRRFAILAVFLLLVVPGRLKADNDSTLPSLAVLGVACDTKSDEWRTGLVGFGIENWVAQSFYDTGHYRMFEERQDVLDQLRTKTDEAYDQAGHDKTEDLSSVAKQLSVDIVAVGKVSTEYSLGQQISIGPFHSLNRDTIVKVDICLYDARTGKITHVAGSGKVGRKGHAFGADFRGGKLPFDASTVAPATEQAVESAVTRIVPDYHPHVRRDEAKEFNSPVNFGVLPLGLAPSVAANYPDVKDKRVAFGIQSRIARAVSDTKNGNLIEIDPAVLDTLAEQWWIGSKGAPQAGDVKKEAPAYKANVDYIVYGEVFAFSIAREEHAEGLTEKVADKVTVGIQLRAVDPSSGDGGYIVASGIGSATGDWQRWRGESDDFAQSFVGQAATAAIADAWAKLTADIAERRQH
jgi:hypothetical protein